MCCPSRFRLISSILFIAFTMEQSKQISEDKINKTPSMISPWSCQIEQCSKMLLLRAPCNVSFTQDSSSKSSCNLLVEFHSFLSYFTGTFLRFSNSNAESTDNSFPWDLRKAFVHLTFLGFLFFLKALWHFDLQNLKTYNTKLIVAAFVIITNIELKCSFF